MKKQLERAFKEAQDAYTLAYGQVHKTPDGMFCWMGRLDRAYTILADTKDDPQSQKKIQLMRDMVQDAYNLADQKYAAYQALAEKSGIGFETIDIECLCSSCNRQATFRFVEALEKCAIDEDGKRGGLLKEGADQFQKDADRLGQTVTWEHYDLHTHQIKEGRGA